MSEEFEVQEEAVEAVETAEVEQVEAVEEKPKRSGYIDYEVIPEGDARDTVRMRVDSDFRKIKESERKLSDQSKKIQEYEAKIAEMNKPKEVAPPAQDDWYEDPDKAQARQKSYNEYIQSQADWNAQNQMSQQQQAAEVARQSADRLSSFVKKSESAGINQAELGYAANVAQSVLGDDVQTHILEHDFGPQLLIQLAKSPMELQEIASLSPYQVGVKLESMAKTFKPTKVTKAPPPDEPIQGSGGERSEEYNGVLKGAKFL